MIGSKITSERILLRPMREDDAEFIVHWRNDPEINQWFFASGPLTLESHLEGFRKTREDRIDYMICLRPELKPIGTVNYTNVAKTKMVAEAGKMLGDKNMMGKGLGKEAFRLWIRYRFKTQGFNEIYVQTYSDNMININLNKSIGFHVEKVIENERKGDVTLMRMYREDATKMGLIKEDI